MTTSTDLQALQTAIPPEDGKILNINNLTEAQAYAQLQTQIEDLNSKMSSLKSEMNWLIFGEASFGIIGEMIAITNFWNPIGWTAAGLSIYGEVEMVGDKAQDVADLNTDLENVPLTQDEEAILRPI